MYAALATKIDNPLDGVVPDFTIFGADFTALWQKLLAGAWALAIVVAVVYVILGVVQMASASGSQNPGAHAEGRKKAGTAFIALCILAALAVLVGAVFAFFG